MPLTPQFPVQGGLVEACGPFYLSLCSWLECSFAGWVKGAMWPWLCRSVQHWGMNPRKDVLSNTQTLLRGYMVQLRLYVGVLQMPSGDTAFLSLFAEGQPL